MPQASDNSVPIRLTWSGGIADSGTLPARQLADALRGWDDAFELITATFRAGRILSPYDPRVQTYGARFQVREFRRGSFEVLGWLRNNSDAVSVNLVSDALFMSMLLAREHLVGFFTHVIDRTLDVKRLRMPLDTAAAFLEAAAIEFGVRTPVDRQDTEHFVRRVDNALQQATSPLEVGIAAEQRIQFLGTGITLTASDRFLLLQPFPTPEVDPVQGLIEADVKFQRINRATRRGSMRFVRPQGPEQDGVQDFENIDPLFTTPGNPYFEAFSMDRPIRVRLQIRRFELGRRGNRWLIDGLVPQDAASGDSSPGTP